MLVLTRRDQECIVIGENIKITILGISGNKVRLGIKAPKTVSVHRQEVYEKIQQEQDETTCLNDSSSPLL